MHGHGLAKLIEELGELQAELGSLIQVAAKKLAFLDTDKHPDGMGSLKTRIEDEAADVIAGIDLITRTLGLDEDRIHRRVLAKGRRFRVWHEPKDVIDRARAELETVNIDEIAIKHREAVQRALENLLGWP